MLLASTCLLAFRSSERRMCFLFPVYKHVTPNGGKRFWYCVDNNQNCYATNFALEVTRLTGRVTFQRCPCRDYAS